MSRLFTSGVVAEMALTNDKAEVAYGPNCEEEQLALDIFRDAALCCRERHSYMPTTENERNAFMPHMWVFEGASEYANHAYAEGRKDEAEAVGWQPIETAPEDENVLVATTGGWVDTAFWTDEDGEGRKWWWLISAKEYAKHPIHASLAPTHWMPLPKHPTA
jgi:hypothetical protein